MNIIKNIREQSGFTQTELADKTGLSIRTIQRLEAKNKEPKGHTLKVLSEVFKLEANTLQEKFKTTKKSKESDIATIQFINLSILSFIGIPFGNIIFPIILWYRNRKSKLVDEIGRRIVNFQIIWWLITSLLLTASPFISRKFFNNAQIILYILFICYALNVIIVFITAMKLKRHDFNFFNIPLRLI